MTDIATSPHSHAMEFISMANYAFSCIHCKSVPKTPVICNHCYGVLCNTCYSDVCPKCHIGFGYTHCWGLTVKDRPGINLQTEQHTRHSDSQTADFIATRIINISKWCYIVYGNGTLSLCLDTDPYNIETRLKEKGLTAWTIGGYVICIKCHECKVIRDAEMVSPKTYDMRPFYQIL